jgi:hypothetical protein
MQVLTQMKVMLVDNRPPIEAFWPQDEVKSLANR